MATLDVLRLLVVLRVVGEVARGLVVGGERRRQPFSQGRRAPTRPPCSPSLELLWPWAHPSRPTSIPIHAGLSQVARVALRSYRLFEWSADCVMVRKPVMW
eukprot:1928971-Prymnesium_polylepis.1